MHASDQSGVPGPERTHGRDGAAIVAAALGVYVGISGLDHGLFEALQGTAATPGPVIQAIGPDHRMWVHGTEEAFTVLPSFLLSGFLAMVVGMAVIVWSVAFVDRPHGPGVLLLLGGLLFLVGGGIGMLVFLLAAWAVARRIGRPLSWARSLPGRMPWVLRRAWPRLIAVGLVLYAFALEIAIVGYVPGVTDPELALNICWLALVASLLAQLGALVGASVPVDGDRRDRVPARPAAATLR